MESKSGSQDVGQAAPVVPSADPLTAVGDTPLAASATSGAQRHAGNLPAGNIDEELQALRSMDVELSHQLVAIEEQMSTRRVAHDRMVARRRDLLREADDVSCRREELKRSLLAMRKDMQQWAEGAQIFDELLHKKKLVNDMHAEEMAAFQRVESVPEAAARSNRKAAKALGDNLAFLEKYVLSLVFAQLSTRGAIEQRMPTGTDVHAQVLPKLLEISEQRERCLHDACGEVDYRGEESMRLESSVKTIAEQCLTETVDLDASKSEQMARIEEAFEEERQALLKVKARLEAETKEIEFHMKRGTLAKGSTKMTSSDMRLHDKVTSQQEELRELLSSFESLRNEKMQLEREAELSLQKLIRSREDQSKQKASVKASLEEIRRFHSELDVERSDWLHTKREMHDLILQQQTKIRAATVAEATSSR